MALPWCEWALLLALPWALLLALPWALCEGAEPLPDEAPGGDCISEVAISEVAISEVTISEIAIWGAPLTGPPAACGEALPARLPSGAEIAIWGGEALPASGAKHACRLVPSPPKRT